MNIWMIGEKNNEKLLPEKEEFDIIKIWKVSNIQITIIHKESEKNLI